MVRPETQEIAEVDQVSDGYLETMGVRLLQGRLFREEEVDPARESPSSMIWRQLDCGRGKRRRRPHLH